MTKFNVTVQSYSGGQPYAAHIEVEAAVVSGTDQWLSFGSQGQAPTSTTTVAIFPRDRVISVVLAE